MMGGERMCHKVKLTAKDALDELQSLTVDYEKRNEAEIERLDRAIDMAMEALSDSIDDDKEITFKDAEEWIRTHTPETVGKWLRAIDKACAALDYMEFMKTQHDCNDCGYKECEHRPKWGDPVRVNCFMWRVKWRAKDGSDREEKQVKT